MSDPTFRVLPSPAPTLTALPTIWACLAGQEPPGDRNILVTGRLADGSMGSEWLRHGEPSTLSFRNCRITVFHPRPPLTDL